MKIFSKNIFFITLAIVLLFGACKEDEYAEWKIINEAWLENHKNDDGFIQTESGLSYKIINSGIIRHPNSSSYIRATYKGKLIDGSTFDEGEFSGSLEGTIPGWQEGIPKIKTNGIMILRIPSSMGYGENGSGSRIPPHSTLEFEIELHESIN